MPAKMTAFRESAHRGLGAVIAEKPPDGQSCESASAADMERVRARHGPEPQRAAPGGP